MSDTTIIKDPPKSDGQDRAQPKRLLMLGGLIAAELLVLSLLYTHNFSFVCRDAAPDVLCAFLSRSVLRAIALFGAGLIFTLASPQLRRLILHQNDSCNQSFRWIRLQLLGFVLMLLPWAFTSDSSSRVVLFLAFVLWVSGAALAAIGAGFALATPQRWQKALKELGIVPIAILALALFAPEITDFANQIWRVEQLTQITFRSVVAVLDVFGVEATARPANYELRSKGFAIAVGWQCSGVEGFALIAAFISCYLYAFRDDLKFPNVWILLPIGLVLSWMLNVVRVAALFAIGRYISPELAVDGFHSHAGWLMFSILALSVIGVSRTVPWFMRNPTAKPHRLPLRQDWIAACIVPFAAFMGAALLLSTFTQTPGLWYVIKVIFMAGALALFLPLYSRITWRIDTVAVAAGAAIGIAWIAINWGHDASDAQLETALATLPAGLLVAWVVLRVSGTVLLVPMVEELFFRGYVLDRLDRGGIGMRLLALGVSSGLFAALHDRWILAAIAGVVYGLLYLRKRQIADTIIAHATSNAVIAIYAVVTLDWSVI